MDIIQKKNIKIIIQIAGMLMNINIKMTPNVVSIRIIMQACSNFLVMGCNLYMSNHNRYIKQT